MHKTTLAVITAILMSGGAALASETWLVTEENTAGVKGAQGNWTVNLEGDKVSGFAEMQEGNGNPLTYKFHGSKTGAAYTITMTDRSDGKKGCVWNGHPPAGAGTQTQGLVGYAECEGVKLIIRASIFGK